VQIIGDKYNIICLYNIGIICVINPYLHPLIILFKSGLSTQSTQYLLMGRLNMSQASVEAIVGERKSQPHQLIEVLQDIQEVQGYISQEAATAVSHYLGVRLIEVYRAASFYKALSLEPRGKHVITLCMGTACHVRGSHVLLDQANSKLGMENGGTTEDGLFTVERVNCLGACAIGPVTVLGGEYHHHMTSAKLSSLIDSVRTAEVPQAGDAASALQYRDKDYGNSEGNSGRGEADVQD
jgi:NADH:ubiquinone oxidoreductase subunit E